MPSGIISSRYSIALQVRRSVNISPMRASQVLPRWVYSGRRGMRTPSNTSTIRPSTSDRTRTLPKNRISRPTETLAPVTTQVK